MDAPSLWSWPFLSKTLCLPGRYVSRHVPRLARLSDGVRNGAETPIGSLWYRALASTWALGAIEHAPSTRVPGDGQKAAPIPWASLLYDDK